MQTVNLTCFVASAFGHRDVDDIYRKAVVPALRQSNVQPLRVDLVEHNDDIDDKILQLIEQCDFCIADLTYARPSVYYEAGRVHGLGKKVIFTVRSDHFRPKATDVNGNLKVHFDLQMKNIIPWNRPDATFIARIKARVELVAKPLLDARAKTLVEQAAETGFSKLALKDRIQSIRGLCMRSIRRRGFRLHFGWRENEGNFIGVRSKGSEEEVVACIVEPSLTGKQLGSLWAIPSQGILGLPSLDTRAGKNPSLVEVFAITLRPVPSTRIEEALDRFSPVTEGAYFCKDRAISGRKAPMMIRFMCPRSLPSLQRDLRKCLDVDLK